MYAKIPKLIVEIPINAMPEIRINFLPKNDNNFPTISDPITSANAYIANIYP